MTSKTKRYKQQQSMLSPYMRAKIIGVLFITIGILLLLNPTDLNLKLSFSMVLIGLISVILIRDKTDISTKKKSKKKTKKSGYKHITFLLSEKITLIISIWILFLLLITETSNMEIFFVAIFIGLLVIKELSDEFTSKNLKYNLNIFIFAFLMVFIAIIGKKIISISSI